jgi:hypothetical protein
MRRVTRAQGIVSACVWDYDSRMRMLRSFWDETVSLDPAAEPKDERHMKLSRQGQLGELWRQAGLLNIKEEPLVVEQAYPLGAIYKRRGPCGRLCRVAFSRSPRAT